jgi:hypothetical protein
MFGFPINLQANDVQKFTNNADSGFPKIQQKEVFYSMKDGNWNDLTIWQTASGRVGKFPTSFDDVYIRHNIALNIDTTINGLFVSGIFTINASFTIGLNSSFIGAANSQLINKGAINFLTQISAEQSYSNGIIDFTTFVNTIQYFANYTATISSAFTTFHNLTIGGTGTKFLGANTTINGNLSATSNGNLDCSIFNLLVLGTTTTSTISALSRISKSGSGTITFTGQVILGQQTTGLDFSGNPDVEFKGGISMYQNTIVSGTGQWKFSTASQAITVTGFAMTFNCTVLISGAITVTMTQSSGGTFTVNNTINGDNASSVLNIGNTSFIFNNISYYLPMSTFGTFIVTSGLIQYSFNGSVSLPYLSYGSLTIGGTGTKTLGGNTTIGVSLQFIQDSTATLECSTFNLTVSGTTVVRRDTSLRKSGAGNVTFIGLLNASTSGAAATINFSGNPNVEFRGGFSLVNTSIVDTGTGTYSFTTNNQSLDTNATTTFKGNIIIGNGITVSYVCTQGGFTSLIMLGTLNGSNATSTFRMGTGTGTPTVSYRSATQPMATGVLDTSTNLNTWIYGLNNQDIKGSPTISPKQVYRNLTLNGTGVKTLQGYCSVLNTYTLTSPATLNLNGFTLTNP